MIPIAYAVPSSHLSPTSQPNRPHLPRRPTASSGNELQEFGVRSVLHRCGSQTACSVSRPVALPNRLAWLVCVVQREGHSSVARHSGNSPTVLRSAWGLPLCHVGLTTRSMPQMCMRACVRVYRCSTDDAGLPTDPAAVRGYELASCFSWRGLG